MRTKKALLTLPLLSTALVLFGATAALANDNAANSGEVGGSKIGPLGQVFSSGPVNGGYSSYGYVAPSHGQYRIHKHSARPASK